jgi:hypothetical protein
MIIEQYYSSTAAGKKQTPGGILIRSLYLATHLQIIYTTNRLARYYSTKNEELYQKWTVILHNRGYYFKIWSSTSCKSVHTRSKINYTRTGT